MNNLKTNKINLIWWTGILASVILISILHYTTSTSRWQFHLVYMQAYFIPILIAAFRFGIKGGLGTAIVVSLIYFPHIMLQWGGLIENNLARFLQLILYNVIGYITGYKANKEMQEKIRYQDTAGKLENSLKSLREQNDQIMQLEEQLHLADRLAIIGELTSSLAHEIRNPLGSILGTVDILREELHLDKEQHEFLDILVQETRRLNQVVENYLGYAKSSKIDDSVFEPAQVLENTRMMLSTKAKKMGIQFDMDVFLEPVSIRGNKTDFYQVVMNLLLNAIQSMQNGGIISIQLFRSVGAVELLIKDQGMGIKKSEIDRIFNPFYTTKSSGTGLGLAIVKRIVKENNWSIHVKSESNKGTIFSLLIPLDKQVNVKS